MADNACDVLAGAKRKKGGSTDDSAGGAPATEHYLLRPTKRMASAATGHAAQQHETASAASALLAPPPSGLSRFGFKTPAPPTLLKPPSVTALSAEPIVATPAIVTPAVAAASNGAISGGNQSEHDEARASVAKAAFAIDTETARSRALLTTAEKVLARSSTTRRASNQQLKVAIALEPEESVSAAPRSSSRTAMKQRSSASSASLLAKKPPASALPTPRSALALSKRSLGSGATAAAAATGAPAVAIDRTPVYATRVRDAFSAAFADNRVEALEELLKFRAKASKFNAKARQDEQVAYIRQLKTAMRAVCDEIRSFDTLTATMDDKIQSERTMLERRLAVLDDSVQSREQRSAQLQDELRRVRSESDALRTETERLRHERAQLAAAEQQTATALSAAEASAAELQTQLQRAQTANDQLTLELRAQQATLSDRVQLYEEKKKELQHFYEHKDSQEERRKGHEIERLQATLSAVREELAGVNKENKTLADRTRDCTNELQQERARRSQLELDKCTREAQLESFEQRCAAAANELHEVKAKLQHKEDEIMKMLTTMTEIQKFTASSNTKLEAEKRELLDKTDALQRTVRELERAEVESASTLRELRAQLESNSGSKEQAEQQARDAHARVKALETELQESARQLSVKVGVCEMLESQARELRNEHVAVNAQMEAVRSEMMRLQQSREETQKGASARAAELEAAFACERQRFQRELEALQEQRVSLESEVQTLRERVSSARDGDLEELCTVKREAEVLRLRLKELASQGTQTVAQKDRLIEELQEKVKVGDKLRRTMHNTIQELRGNVRVFARTRPFLPSDRRDDSAPDALVPAISCEYDGQTMKLKRPGKGGEPEMYAFSFDKVFAPSMGQDAVFDEVAEFVQSSLDGYHVCLFSYGQTGSGKTHTMQGSGNGQMRGIIPRSIEKVLLECAHLTRQGWRYRVQVSFLEIYNETLKDLLARRDESSDSKLAIKKDARGSGVHVPDLTLVDVTAVEQVEALMERASRARSVASTDMNAQSSRSHSVFTLHLQGVHDGEGVSLDGKLNLVDLAGSERASRSNVSGDRLKETQAINKSLSCLADVFTAIGNKSSHIPFRNSKLTYLLQSSLSGDGKTLMMVNLSPTLESAGESLCSLRFAKQVNQCELGKPKRQIKSKRDPQT